MNESMDRIETFVKDARARLNRRRLWTAFAWTAAIAGAVMLLIAIFFVLRGRQVPAAAYLGVVSLAAIASFASWRATLLTAEDAAAYADGFFDLKEALVSCRHFAQEKLEGGMYELQARQTQQAVASLEVASIPCRAPHVPMWTGVVLVVAAALLGLIGDSPAVIALELQQEQTLARTEEINEHLEQMIEELQKETKDEQEEKLLEASKLREWVNELKGTTDQKDALRQYARLEKKLAEASARLDTQRDEKLLAMAAVEMKKVGELRDLSQKLKDKDYKAAAAELDQLKPKESKPLTEQQKELARLKSAAQRLAEAAKAMKEQAGKSSSASSKSNRTSKANTGKAREGKPREGDSDKANENDANEGDTEMSEEDLGDTIEELDEDVEALEEAIEEALRELELDPNAQECLGRCEKAGQKVSVDLKKLGDKLRKLSAQKKAQDKLSKLRKTLSQCQSGMCNNPGESLARLLQPGGKEAGKGVDRTKNDKPVEDGKGSPTLLTGQKGTGPSLTAVEAADDGTGVSSRRAAARSIEFRRQFESFVNREDVPEDVKQGVKAYFENIHQADEAAGPQGPRREGATTLPKEDDDARD